MNFMIVCECVCCYVRKQALINPASAITERVDMGPGLEGWGGVMSVCVVSLDGFFM